MGDETARIEKFAERVETVAARRLTFTRAMLYNLCHGGHFQGCLIQIVSTVQHDTGIIVRIDDVSTSKYDSGITFPWSVTLTSFART